MKYKIDKLEDIIEPCLQNVRKIQTYFEFDGFINELVSIYINNIEKQLQKCIDIFNEDDPIENENDLL